MTALTHWNPFRSLGRRDDAFDEFFRDFAHRFGDDGPLQPSVDLAESEQEVTLTMPVPGVAKEQLHVEIDDDEVRVRGEVRRESEQKKKHYYRQEIRYGAFERAVRLPTEVDAAKAHADLKNGVLTIVAPKTSTAKARRVEIAVH